MNLYFLKHELLVMFRSKKNILFILFLTILLVSYCLLVLPNKKTIDSFNTQEMIYELEERSAEQRDREARGWTGTHLHTNFPFYAMYEYNDRLYSSMITALEKQEYTRFVYLKMHDLEMNRSILGDESLFAKSPFPGKDRKHLYHQTLMRNQAYLNLGLPITYAMIEQKTALQTLHSFLLSSGSLFILFCAIYFSSDVLSRDRQNRTVLQGFPLTWFSVLNLKTIATLMYTFTILFVLLILGMIIISFQNGFGYFNLQVPIIIARTDFSLADYDYMSIGKFILLALSAMPLTIYIFIRLNIVLSLLFKNEWLVLIVSSFFLFIETLYFTRTLRELFGIEISYFPQTYFEFGKIVSSDKNFLVNLETITYAKGFIVLIITAIIIEMILLIVSRIVNKRRFYQ